MPSPARESKRPSLGDHPYAVGQVQARSAVFGEGEQLLKPAGGAGRWSASRVVGQFLDHQTRERRMQDAQPSEGDFGRAGQDVRDKLVEDFCFIAQELG